MEQEYNKSQPLFPESNSSNIETWDFLEELFCNEVAVYFQSICKKLTGKEFPAKIENASSIIEGISIICGKELAFSSFSELLKYSTYLLSKENNYSIKSFLFNVTYWLTKDGNIEYPEKNDAAAIYPMWYHFSTKYLSDIPFPKWIISIEKKTDTSKKNFNVNTTFLHKFRVHFCKKKIVVIGMTLLLILLREEYLRANNPKLYIRWLYPIVCGNKHNITDTLGSYCQNVNAMEQLIIGLFLSMPPQSYTIDEEEKKNKYISAYEFYQTELKSKSDSANIFDDILPTIKKRIVTISAINECYEMIAPSPIIGKFSKDLSADIRDFQKKYCDTENYFDELENNNKREFETHWKERPDKKPTYEPLSRLVVNFIFPWTQIRPSDIFLKTTDDDNLNRIFFLINGFIPNEIYLSYESLGDRHFDKIQIDRDHYSEYIAVKQFGSFKNEDEKKPYLKVLSKENREREELIPDMINQYFHAEKVPIDNLKKGFDSLSLQKFNPDVEKTINQMSEDWDSLKSYLELLGNRSMVDQTYSVTDIRKEITKYIMRYQSADNLFEITTDFSQLSDSEYFVNINTTLLFIQFNAILSNAKNHGFVNYSSNGERKVLISAKHEHLENPETHKPGDYICLSYANNGRPIQISVDRFKTKGAIDGITGHSGIGGYHINEIAKKHDGFIDIEKSKMWNTIIKVYLKHG